MKIKSDFLEINHLQISIQISICGLLFLLHTCLKYMFKLFLKNMPRNLNILIINDLYCIKNNLISIRI